MALPSYDDIHLPLLKLIVNHRIHSIKTAEQMLAQTFELTDEELKEKHKSGIREFFYQVTLSTIRQIEAGLIFPRFIPFKTTDTARQLLAKKPKKITNRDIDELIKRRKNLKAQKEEELARQALLNSYDEYLQELKTLNETYFERVTGLVLSKVCNTDFLSNVEITPPSNDGGIDGIIHLGESDESKVYFEAKCYTDGIISRKLVQQFSGALDPYDGIVGYYVTTVKFTKRAKEYVDSIKKVKRYKDIRLIDGHRLVELIFKYNLENEVIPIKQ
ncbi:restriction endonuclease [Peribacillus simplex]|uniref:restriction endonuclease n=1 Tax=Peribacillus simplex TaxID=1478 RepID=UPI0024C16BA6|nr:restriction endonuclease [Peribacillus simplex]WHX92021.1 restriction endonuclease [Peribacillus simplex]